MMKKLFCLLFTVMSLTAFVGCEKSDPINNLIGRWQLVSYDFYIEDIYIDTTQETEEVILEITENRILDGEIEDTYVLDGNNIVIGEGDNVDIWEIIENTPDKLSLKISEEDFYLIMNFKRA